MNTYPLGDTILLSETFTVNGTQTDPTTVSLLVQDPSGAQTTYTYAGAQVVRVSAGAYQYELAVPVTGTWSYRWTGTGAAPGVGEGEFGVYDLVAGDSTATPAGSLASVNEYKAFVGQDFADTSQDAMIRLWLAAASTAIQVYTRREFISALGTGTRNFEVRSTGYVSFRRYDLQSASLVAIDTEGTDGVTATTIDPSQYMLLPVDAPDGVYTSLRFYTFSVGPILRQVYGVSRQVSVTGTWGYPAVPADVKRAALLCARDWKLGYSDSYSETLAPRMNDEITTGRADNIPAPARLLLDPYRKVLV